MRPERGVRGHWTDRRIGQPLVNRVELHLGPPIDVPVDAVGLGAVGIGRNARRMRIEAQRFDARGEFNAAEAAFEQRMRRDIRP